MSQSDEQSLHAPLPDVLGDAKPSARRPIHPGPGSWRVLLWLARLGVAGVEPMRCGLGLSRSTLYSHLRRLQQAGLLVPVGPRDGAGGIFAITERGATIARADGVPTVRPRVDHVLMGRHARAVSWVAAYAELHETAWLGPAGLRQDRGWRLQRTDGRRHMPDLGLVSGGKRRAIEVELTAKGPDRLSRILLAYRRQMLTGPIDQVTYIYDKPAVARLVERVGRPILGPWLFIHDLADVVERVRRRAADGASS